MHALKKINLFRLTLLACASILVACSSDDQSANGEFSFRDGVDYQTLSRQVATEDPSKIEIAEAFWYGCIHCYRFEPLLEEFAASLPEDVNLVKIPVVWTGPAELHAKIYYASTTLGVNDEIHMQVFKALNDERRNLASESDILNYMEDIGQNRTAFQRAFNSFGVTNQIDEARAKTSAYGIRGTPELVVNGKYRVSSSMTGSTEQMLVVAAALIEREREALNQ